MNQLSPDVKLEALLLFLGAIFTPLHQVTSLSPSAPHAPSITCSLIHLGMILWSLETAIWHVFQVPLSALGSRLRSKPPYFSLLLIQLTLTQNLLPCNHDCEVTSVVLPISCSNKEVCMAERLSDTSEWRAAAFYSHPCRFTTDGRLEESYKSTDAFHVSIYIIWIIACM